MRKYFLISSLILFVFAGCRSNASEYPKTDPCLALHTIGLPQCSPPNYEAPTRVVPTPGYGKLMREEVTYRLKQIHSLLAQEPVSQGALSKAVTAITSDGPGITEEYKDWPLINLLNELGPVTLIEERDHINNIKNALYELEQLAPQAPVSEQGSADSRQVREARKLLKEMGKEWDLLLQHSQ